MVHCSATRPSQDVSALDIDGWHTAGNGWTAIGYHFVIRRDGTVEGGRPLHVKGAHVAGHNHDSVGICLVGGVAQNGTPDKGPFEDNFTYAQCESLRGIIEFLTGIYPNATVLGHRDLDANKKCPVINEAAYKGVSPR